METPTETATSTSATISISDSIASPLTASTITTAPALTSPLATTSPLTSITVSTLTSSMTSPLAPTSALTSISASTLISSLSDFATTATSNDVPTSTSAASTAPPTIDPLQLVFSMGQTTISPSKNDNMHFASRSPPAPSVSPVASTSRSGLTVEPTSRSGLTVEPTSRSGLTVEPTSRSELTVTAVPSTGQPKNTPSLFGNYISKTASNTPKRFHFETNRTTVEHNSRPTVQSKFSDSASSTTRYNTSVSQRTPNIPNLSPEVTIRPITIRNPTTTSGTSSRKIPQQKPDFNSNDMFKLLAGYNHLTSEVAGLKRQLSESQSLINEILGNFSSEVARLNVRLTAVEEQVQRGRCNEEGESQDLSTQLGDLSLTKKEENDSL